VKRVMLSLPSVGFCPLHGLKGHVCYLYTVSEDRTICMWNIATCQPIRNYTSPVLRQSVLTSLAQSPRHLMAGTSDASVSCGAVEAGDKVCLLIRVPCCCRLLFSRKKMFVSDTTFTRAILLGRIKPAVCRLRCG
jgi:hypothetical protein